MTGVQTCALPICSYTSLVPQLSNDNLGNVYIAFSDDRNGGMDILLNYSTDFGTSWQATPERINTGSPLGSGSGYVPRLNIDSSGNIYVAWVDSRNGAYDIYFNSSSPPVGKPIIPTLSDYMMILLGLALLFSLIIMLKARFSWKQI